MKFEIVDVCSYILLILKLISLIFVHGVELSTNGSYYKISSISSPVNETVVLEEISTTSLLSCNVFCFKKKRPSFYYNQDDSKCYCNFDFDCSLHVQNDILASEYTTGKITYGFYTKCNDCDIRTPGVEHGSVDVASDGRIVITCNAGFMTSAGPNIDVVPDCDENGIIKNVTCFPVTCKDIAESGVLAPGSYDSFDIGSGQMTRIFCDFNTSLKIAYSYLSRETLEHVSSLSNHYQSNDHVIIRHKSDENLQYESKIQMMSYWQPGFPNVSVFLNSQTNFSSPEYETDYLYMYLSFVPGDLSVGYFYGYSSDGVDKLYENCDGNPMNYFVLYKNPYGSITKGPVQDEGIAVQWKDCKQSLDTFQYMPLQYYYGTFIIHFGGCGGLSRSNVSGVSGIAFGLPFNYK